MGLPKNTPFAESINYQLITYREEGLPDTLYKKWWPSDDICKQKQTGTTTLDMSSMAGIFYFLAAAVAISLCLVVVELLYAAIMDVREAKPYNLITNENGNAKPPDDPCDPQFINFSGKVSSKKGSSVTFCGALGNRIRLLCKDIWHHWCSPCCKSADNT